MSSLNGINGSQSLQQIFQLLKTQTISATDDVSQGTTSNVSWGNANGAVSFEMSKPGEVMSKLAQLKESDPEKFKQLTAEISQKLKDTASQTTGREADFLNTLADKFQQASDTGDLSVLQPPNRRKAIRTPRNQPILVSNPNSLICSKTYRLTRPTPARTKRWTISGATS